MKFLRFLWVAFLLKLPLSQNIILEKDGNDDLQIRCSENRLMKEKNISKEVTLEVFSIGHGHYKLKKNS